MKFNLKMPKITGALNEDVFTFLTVSRLILLRVRKVLDKSYRENQNTHFRFSFVFETPAVYEIMSKHMAEQERPHMAI